MPGSYNPRSPTPHPITNGLSSNVRRRVLDRKKDKRRSERESILCANANTPPWSRSPSRGPKKERPDVMIRRSPSVEILPARTKVESPPPEIAIQTALPTPVSPRSARPNHDPSTSSSCSVHTDAGSIPLSHPLCNDKGKQRAEPFIPFPSSVL